MGNGNSIATFLHYGYLPRTAEAQLTGLLSGVERRDSKGRGDQEGELIDRGIAALAAAFAGVEGGRPQVVPLSGGLDSRAILAGLLAAGRKEDLVAVTFGSPGTLDFEIGPLVAREAGVDSVVIDLQRARITQELLESAVTEGASWTYLFEAALSRTIYRRFGREPTYWSGFMGDPLAGSHLLPRESRSWDEARRRFAERNRFVTSTRSTPPDFEPESVLPDQPLVAEEVLSFDEQLDFSIRQPSCVRPLVVPRGYDCRTPFLSRPWVDFSLALPRRYRRSQYLYKKILCSFSPGLFSLPTKANFGLPLETAMWRRSTRWLRMGFQKKLHQAAPFVSWPIYPLLNYLDFDEELRRRADFRTLVHDNLVRLMDRGVVDWLNIDSIWKKHQRRRGNHSDLMLALAALEVNLESQKNEAATSLRADE